MHSYGFSPVWNRSNVPLKWKYWLQLQRLSLLGKSIRISTDGDLGHFAVLYPWHNDLVFLWYEINQRNQFSFTMLFDIPMALPWKEISNIQWQRSDTTKYGTMLFYGMETPIYPPIYIWRGCFRGNQLTMLCLLRKCQNLILNFTTTLSIFLKLFNFCLVQNLVLFISLWTLFEGPSSF